MFRVEFGGIIVIFGFLKYLFVIFVGKMVIIWENKVEWRVFEVMFIVLGCVGFIL